MAISMFTPSVTGMDAQSHAMNTVSTNIANIRTVGYKSSETMFYTLLGTAPVVKGNNVDLSSSRVDIDGVGYYDRTNVTAQGQVNPTGGAYDVAINGTGNAFFLVNDGYGNNYYTRAGDFISRTLNGQTYLMTENGYNVQGFVASGGGFAANPSNIELNFQERMPSTPTTQMEVTANVDAASETDNSYSMTVYGPDNDGRNMTMRFSRVDGAANLWNVTFSVEDGTVVSQPIEAVFDEKGGLISPKTFDLTVNWNDEAGGGSNTIHMDISHMTQYAGNNELTHVSQDGKEGGDFQRSYIDSDGILKAKYSNGKTIDVAKLAIVGFTAPENLVPVSNTMFQATPDAGESNYIDPKGILAAGSLEASTATVETEFSKMVVIQRAYSLNTQSFTVTDEMIQEVVNLKT